MRAEKTGRRDLAFSMWHRETCPDSWGMIDADFVGFCRDCNEPLFLVEHANDVGQSHKSFDVTKALAAKAGIPAYVVLYGTNDEGFITSFRFRQVQPYVDSKFSPKFPPGFLRDLFEIERMIHRQNCDRSAVRF
jgi:hypothetical protein